MLPAFMDPVFYLLGEAVFVLGVVILIVSVVAAVMIGHSFRTGRIFMARPTLIFVILLESVIKYLFRVYKADESVVDLVGVRLRNYINSKKFLEIDPEDRSVFMPQCVRSVDCPAKLTPEGIMCVNCGRCGIGEAKIFCEERGYRFFIVPGSSFIKRMIKEYQPQAIVGVGCMMEIKEGIDLCHLYGIPAIGVPLSKSGCVSTILDWDRFYEVVSDGDGHALLRDDLKDSIETLRPSTADR